MNNKRKGKFITYCGGDFEDIIIAKAFDGIKKGFYIDVGANHPVERNVTKHFYDNGWNGINIEPLKKEYELLAGERSNDINLNMGLADKKGARGNQTCRYTPRPDRRSSSGQCARCRFGTECNTLGGSTRKYTCRKARFHNKYSLRLGAS